MATELQYYSDAAARAANEIAGQSGNWMQFLNTAARFYKYSFPDQLMIYAQKPDATACASLEVWNSAVNRWVKRGARGIALIDDADGGNPRLKYVFNVSDTEESRYPPLDERQLRRQIRWELRPEHEVPVTEALVKTYDIDAQSDLGDTLCVIAGQLATKYYEDHQHDIFNSVAGRTLGRGQVAQRRLS